MTDTESYLVVVRRTIVNDMLSMVKVELENTNYNNLKTKSVEL